MTIRNIRFALTAFGVAIALAAPRNDVVAQSGGAGAVVIFRDTSRLPFPSENAVMEQVRRLQLLESAFAQMMREFNVEIQSPSRLVVRNGPTAYQSLQRLFLDVTSTLDRLCRVPTEANTAWLGVAVLLAEPMQSDVTVKVAQYPRVIQVERGSPAEKAGISSGDVILKVDGKDLRDVLLQQFITEPGKVVSLSLDRAGTPRHVQAVLGKRGEPQSCELARSSPNVSNLLRMDSVVARRYKTRPIDARDTVNFSRFIVIDSGRAARGGWSGEQVLISNGIFERTTFEIYYGAWFVPMAANAAPGAKKTGVLVRMVEPNTNAERGGLRKNDLVTRVGKKTVTGMQDLKDGLDAMVKQSSVEFEVIRDDKPLVLRIPMR